MRRSLKWIVLILVAAAIFLVAYRWLHPPELVFKGKPVSAWAHQIQASNETESQEALEVFNQLGDRAVRDLIRTLLRERNVAERFRESIRTKGPRWMSKFFPAPREYAGHYHRAGAARALGHIAPQKPQVIRALSIGLTDPELTVVARCAAALAQGGNAGINALWAGMAPSESEDRRAICAYGFTKIKEPGAAAFEKAANRLDDPSSRVRNILISFLERPEAVKAILPQLASESKDAKLAATEALRRIGPRAGTEAGHALRTLFDDESVEVRLAAMESFYRVWLGRNEVVEAMGDLSTDDDPEVRATAIKLLAARARFRPLEDMAPIQRALLDSDPQARGWAAVALGHMPGKAAAYAETLEVLAEDPEDFVRTNALETLGKIQGDADGAR